MAITITMGKPNRWRRWHMTGLPSGSDSARPAPGSWFFEARYHHSGTWKIGLDFRPLNGKMPELWHPPFMWRPAHEITAAEKQLETLGGIADLMGMDHGFNKLSNLNQQIHEYAKSAKTQKKMLFGSAEGSGAHQHAIKTALGDIPIVESPLMPPGTLIAVDPAAITYGLGLDKSMISNAELVHKHLLPNTPMKEWQVQGQPLPYDPVLYSEQIFKWPVRVILLGMVQSLSSAAWNCDLLIEVTVHGNVYTSKLMISIDYFMLENQNTPPVIQVPAMRVMEMSTYDLRLELELKYGHVGGEILSVLYEDTPVNEGMFPMDGLVTAGYTVWNQKLLP